MADKEGHEVISNLSVEDKARLVLLAKAVKLKLSAGEWSINDERIDEETLRLLERLSASRDVGLGSATEPLVEVTHVKMFLTREVVSFEEAYELYLKAGGVSSRKRDLRLGFLEGLRKSHPDCVMAVGTSRFSLAK